jgi:hypothetical protein
MQPKNLIRPKSLLFSFLLIFPTLLPAQINQSELRFSGMINLPDLKEAFLESGTETFILAEGENESSATHSVELVKIDFENKTAKASDNKMPVSLNLNYHGQTNPADAPPTFILERANFDAVLKLYSHLLGRTLLRHPLLPETDFTFSVRALNRKDAIHAIESALKEKGIVFIPDGDVFALIVPKNIAAKLKVKPFKSPATNSPRDISYNFPSTPLQQVADIYANLLGYETDRDAPFRYVERNTLKLQTETKITKEEAKYALGTLFAWAGIEMVPDGQGLMKAVRLAKKK